MSKISVRAMARVMRLFTDIVIRATHEKDGYIFEGVFEFFFPFMNTLVIGSWVIKIRTRRIHKSRFYLKLEIYNTETAAIFYAR